jgi:hypothetical protein
MILSRKILLLLAAVLVGTPALADSWKDESGHGRGEGKEEYWDGNCKIVREWKRNGEYKEEIKCDRPPYPRSPRMTFREPIHDPSALPPPPPGPSYSEIYRDSEGRYCREYQAFSVIDRKVRRLYGTACLQPDGAWAFMD